MATGKQSSVRGETLAKLVQPINLEDKLGAEYERETGEEEPVAKLKEKIPEQVSRPVQTKRARSEDDTTGGEVKKGSAALITLSSEWFDEWDFSVDKSPLSEAIESQIIPKDVKLPKARTYDGVVDPVTHLGHIKQVMKPILVPADAKELCYCTCLATSLVGDAMDWYEKLPPHSIGSFVELAREFVLRFGLNKKPPKKEDDLFAVMQRRGERLEDYVNRFNMEMATIPTCDAKTAADAFKKGLDVRSDLYKKIVKASGLSYSEMIHLARREIRWDEDVSRRRGTEDRKRTEVERPRNEGWGNESSRPRWQGRETKKPYRTSRNLAPEYQLSIPPVQCVSEMRKIPNVRWPGKLKVPESAKDVSKWCDFHTDFGHTTG